jgi:hypothetical protein
MKIRLWFKYHWGKIRQDLNEIEVLIAMTVRPAVSGIRYYVPIYTVPYLKRLESTLYKSSDKFLIHTVCFLQVSPRVLPISAVCFL